MKTQNSSARIPRGEASLATARMCVLNFFKQAMKNSELFLYFGKIGATFVLSLFDLSPDQIDVKLYLIMSLIASIVIWVWILRIAIAIIKKATGFDQPRPRQ